MMRIIERQNVGGKRLGPDLGILEGKNLTLGAAYSTATGKHFVALGVVSAGSGREIAVMLSKQQALAFAAELIREANALEA